MTQGKRQLSGSILILIFVFYYANISFFYHSHTINRLTIRHSHFHGINHTKTGTHSDSEISFIAVLSAFQSLQAALCCVGAGLFLSFMIISRIGKEENPVSVVYGAALLRAPPVSF
jgi:hypothetical protein